MCPSCSDHSKGICYACFQKLMRETPVPEKVVEPLTVSGLFLALFSKLRTGRPVLRSRSE
jgi:hypothetical protein